MEDSINWCVVPEEYVLHTVHKNKIGKWTYDSYDAVDLKELQIALSYFVKQCTKGHKNKDEMLKRGVDYEFAIFVKSKEIEEVLKYEE
jgi:hypothetical protein